MQKKLKAQRRLAPENLLGEVVKWEYMTTKPSFLIADRMQMLNRHGQEGWEAVCEMGNGTVLLKRIAPNAEFRNSASTLRRQLKKYEQDEPCYICGSKPGMPMPAKAICSRCGNAT